LRNTRTTRALNDLYDKISFDRADPGISLHDYWHGFLVRFGVLISGGPPTIALLYRIPLMGTKRLADVPMPKRASEDQFKRTRALECDAWHLPHEFMHAAARPSKDRGLNKKVWGLHGSVTTQRRVDAAGGKFQSRWFSLDGARVSSKSRRTRFSARHHRD